MQTHFTTQARQRLHSLVGVKVESEVVIRQSVVA